MCVMIYRLSLRPASQPSNGRLKGSDVVYSLVHLAVPYGGRQNACVLCSNIITSLLMLKKSFHFMNARAKCAIGPAPQALTKTAK